MQALGNAAVPANAAMVGRALLAAAMSLTLAIFGQALIQKCGSEAM